MRNTPSYVGDYNGLSSLKTWLSGELGARPGSGTTESRNLGASNLILQGAGRG
jgi:hypothetical protein